MLKKICLGAAFFWAGIILYLCLIRISELPALSIPYIDKLLHAFFYFVFSLLWFYALRFNSRSKSRAKILWIVFFLSLFFGIAIELFQTYLTTYRSGDILDVLANMSGTLLAILIIIILDKKDFLSKIPPQP
ncbi:VanZ family protein [Flavobacterium sp. FZUC8N2.13]|uniref:VanZ family protein n=1 Tax=Flavobacterium zubiriense TaxID=3138075 RepID=A0ABV4TA49_9FLAO